MNPNVPNSDQDLGEPIRALREQELETSEQFVTRVRGKIHRRTAASQVVTYSWNLPKASLLELVRLLSHFLETFGTRK